jgi:hypothetical protein
MDVLGRPPLLPFSCRRNYLRVGFTRIETSGTAELFAANRRLFKVASSKSDVINREPEWTGFHPGRK